MPTPEGGNVSMAAEYTPNLVPPDSPRNNHASRRTAIARSLAALALILSGFLAVALVNAQEDPTEPSSTPAGTPEATPSADMPRLELDLEELNDSGITGTVTLFDAGERTIVEFDVEGAGGDHPVNISAGVCGELDPEPVHELEPVNEDGESLTVIDATLDELLEEDHAIDMRLAPDELGTLIACVNIEGEPELPADGTPVASPTSDGTGGQVDATETPDVAETPEVSETPVETPAATETTDEVSTPEADGTGGAVAGAVTFPLRELNDSGVSGTVMLTEQGSATLVAISLDGDAITGDHVAHLHSGTCEDPGDYTFTLNPVDADGTSETAVNLTIDELTSGNYMINIHPSEENWDAWMVCGELVTTSTGDETPVATAAPTTEAGGVVDTTTPAPTTTAPQPTTTTQAPQATVETTPAPVAGGDGTAGVSGTVAGTTAPGSSVQTLPEQAGVGAMLDWPDNPRIAVLWASTGGALVMVAAACFIRRGERHQTANPSRWRRLGI